MHSHPSLKHADSIAYGIPGGLSCSLFQTAGYVPMVTQTACSGDVTEHPPKGDLIGVPRPRRFTGARRVIVIALASLLGWALILAPLLWNLE